MVELTTARLQLREPHACDADGLRRYYLRNAERFSRFEPAPDDRPEVLRAWLAMRGRESARGTGRTFLAYARERAAGGAGADDPVGLVHLDAIAAEDGSAMIGYSIDAAYEGRGYAGEMVDGALAHLRSLGVARVTATYHPGNARSARLLSRRGFDVVAAVQDVPDALAAYVRPHVVAVLDRTNGGNDARG